MSIAFLAQGQTVQDTTVVAFGDGVSTSITADLSQAPFNVDFNHNPPSFVSVITSQVVVNGSLDNSFTLSAALSGTKLTLTWNKALPQRASLPDNNNATYAELRFYWM